MIYHYTHINKSMWFNQCHKKSFAPLHARIQKVLSEGGPTLTTFFLVDEGREDPSTIISGPSSARQRNAITGHRRPTSQTPLNGVSLACQWWPNIECWLSSCSFSGDPENPIFLWFFRGGGGFEPPAPPPPLWIRTWFEWYSNDNI